jgi:hypothetical protein
MYLEKYIQEYGCWHQFREMVEETAHKNGEEKHIAIVFDEEEEEEEEEEDLETKLHKVCSKIVIRPEDSVDHLIGKVPRTRKK